jgi:AcrR family transcriptional regulator
MMPRPSQQIDQALLQSGRALFAQHGCAGLSLRAVAEHAGVNVGMFHYHFKSKNNFLRTLLQQMYEEMFATLSLEAAQDGDALTRLRGALFALAKFARDHRRVLARVWSDAMAGEAVAQEFFRDNAPRHLGVLFGLMQQAQAQGALRELPVAQRFAFLAGSIVMPLIFAAGLIEAGLEGTHLRHSFEQDVTTDAAIAARIDIALAALGAAVPKSTQRAAGGRA